MGSMALFNGSTCADNLPYCYDPPTVLICPESCDGHDVRASCFSDGLPSAGETDCVACCFIDPIPAPPPRTPKVRGCGRAALASEAKCNKNKRCKWVFGSHACMSDCALASKSKYKCNKKKHLCKYKTKKAPCRADETCGVKKRNDPKYD